MSVPVDKRKQSEIEYLYSSMVLRDFCVTSISRFSQKYQEFLVKKIADLAWECHSHCQHADMLPDSKPLLPMQLSDLYNAVRCCNDIDSACTLLLKKLKQNPENFDRLKKLNAEARYKCISEFLERLAEYLVKTKEAIAVRMNIVEVLIKS